MATVKAQVKDGAYVPLRDIAIPTGKSLKVAGVTVDADTLAMDGLTATAAELNLLDAAPATVGLSAAAGAANVCDVTITVKDAAGSTLAGIRNLDVWLSDAATGAGLTAVTASGTVQAKTGEGTDLTALTAKKHLKVQTKAAGTYVLEITDTAKTGFYVCVKNPLTGAPVVSAQLVSGNYGA